MSPYKIATLGGDGIGPEVVASAIQVLEAVDGASFAFTEYSVGAGEYLKSGDPLPEATLEALKTYDAILLGAMGLPSVRWPNGVEMTPQIDLREKLDLYQGVRPIKLYHPLQSPLFTIRANARVDRAPERISFPDRWRLMAEGNVAADELRLLIERIERLEEEKKAIADDVKDVYAEAKARGYDTKTMRTIVRLRKMESQARQEADALLETYRAALGLD